MAPPQQSFSFPTFAAYWKNLILPKRRTVPVLASSKGKQNQTTQSVIEGTLAISKTGSYMVDGREFAIDVNTKVFGELKIGSNASVNVTTDAAGRRRAMKIVTE